MIADLGQFPTTVSWHVETAAPVSAGCASPAKGMLDEIIGGKL